MLILRSDKSVAEVIYTRTSAFDLLSSGFILWPNRVSATKEEERYHIVILCQVELHVSREPVLVSGRVPCTSGGSRMHQTETWNG